MAYTGYYINLDRDTDRRSAMEAQLQSLGPEARYRRFPAVEGNVLGVTNSTLSDNELGCFCSHYLLLQMHLDGASHLHIIEDDTILAANAPHFLDHAVASGVLDNFDLLFTESQILISFDTWRAGRRQYRDRIDRAADGTAAEVRFAYVPYIAGTTSYLVNRGSIRLVCDILGEALELGANRPVDLLIREKTLEGKLRVKCLFPFVTTIGLGNSGSTIARDDERRHSRFAMELLRRSFFVECDFKALLKQAEQGLPHVDVGIQARLHHRLGEFIDSDAYRDF